MSWESFPSAAQGELGGSFETPPDQYMPILVEAFYEETLRDPDSPAAAYIRERLTVLCGTEYNVPATYITRRGGINAFALSGAIAAQDGCFQHLEHTEELDALLGHELYHSKEGQICARSSAGTPLDKLGATRAEEIEADIFSMWLLDKRGINPLGMISIIDKLMAERQRQRQKRLPTTDEDLAAYHSPTHGIDLERKTMLEQVLMVMDAKHLSPVLHPLEPKAAGDAIQLGDQKFWALPAPLQQAILHGAAKDAGYPSPYYTTVQKQILQATSAETDENTLDRQAQLLLAALDSFPLPRPPEAAPDALRHDLSLLTTAEVQSLMGKKDREEVGSRLIVNHLQAALLNTANTANTAEAVVAIADAVNDNERELTLGDLAHSHRVLEATLTTELLTQLRPEQQAQAIEKIARFATNTVFDYGAFVGKISEELIKAKINMQGISVDTFMATTLHQIDRYFLSAVEQQPSLISKVAYVAKHTNPRSGDYRNWGVGMTQTDQGMHILPESFAHSLIQKVQSAPAATLVEEFFASVDGFEKPSVVRAVAALLEALYTSSGPAMAYNQRLEGKEWSTLLPVLLVARKDDKIGDELEMLITGRSELASHDEPIPADQPLQETLKTILVRLRQTTKTLATLEKTHPGLTCLDLDKTVRHSSLIKDVLLHDALKSLSKDSGAKLVTLLQQYGVPKLMVGNLYKNEQELQSGSRQWCDAVEAVLATPGWSESEDQLLVLAALGLAAPEIELNLAVAEYAFGRIARHRDFEGAVQLLEEFPYAGPAARRAILEVLIEEKAQTAGDFERLNEITEAIYADTIADNFDVLGAASIADTIAIPFYATKKASERSVGLKSDLVTGLESPRLLAALLSSGQDDQPLKLWTAERWWLEKRTNTLLDSDYNSLGEYFTAEDYVIFRHPSKQGRLQHWLNHDYPRSGDYTPFDNTLSNLYLQTTAGRFFAVRKLLLTEGDGVLHNPQGSQDLVEALMQSWLAAEEGTDEGSMLRDLLLDLIGENDAATAYLHIGPMLQDMILKPPKTPSDLRPITEEIAKNLTNTLVARGRLPKVTEADYEAIHTRVHRLFTGPAAGAVAKADTMGAIQVLKMRLLEAIGAVDNEPTAHRLSTASFAALAGKQSGGLGVKMLQLGKQYFDLPDEDKEAFEGVYDDMKGQTRLQAYNVLKREAAYNPVIAELFSSIQRFGPRVGGGSLFTVYEIELNNGQRRAVGIKNPNAEYRITRLADFMATGLDKTGQRHPDSSTLQLLPSLLEDGCQWVLNELHDPDFYHKDTVFKAENDTLKGAGFKKGTSRYHLTAPEAADTKTEWVRNEAFIDGKNFTQLKISDDQPSDIVAGVIHQEDFKQATSLVARNWVHQVMRGSYAHSDIHPGNLCISFDNSRVVIFDRRNLIPMHARLRDTLRSAFEHILSDDAPGAAMALAAYATTDAAALTRVTSLLQATDAQAKSPSQLVMDVMLALRREGVRVPLDLSIQLRNFMSVSLLSAQAGFENLAEAFLHTSSGLDELMQLGNPNES